MTLIEHMRIPPFIYRLIARVREGGKYRPMTVRELSARGQIPLRSVSRISGLRSFATVRVATVDRFIMACGYDPMNQRKALRVLRQIWRAKNGWSGAKHLRRTKRLSLLDKSIRARQLRRVKMLLP